MTGDKATDKDILILQMFRVLDASLQAHFLADVERLMGGPIQHKGVVDHVVSVERDS